MDAKLSEVQALVYVYGVIMMFANSVMLHPTLYLFISHLIKASLGRSFLLIS